MVCNDVEVEPVFQEVAGKTSRRDFLGHISAKYLAAFFSIAILVAWGSETESARSKVCRPPMNYG